MVKSSRSTRTECDGGAMIKKSIYGIQIILLGFLMFLIFGYSNLRTVVSNDISSSLSTSNDLKNITSKVCEQKEIPKDYDTTLAYVYINADNNVNQLKQVVTLIFVANTLLILLGCAGIVFAFLKKWQVTDYIVLSLISIFSIYVSFINFPLTKQGFYLKGDAFKCLQTVVDINSLMLIISILIFGLIIKFLSMNVSEDAI